MTVKLLTEHHLGHLSLKGGCTGLFESTLVKMPHCWKSHVATQIMAGSYSPCLLFCGDIHPCPGPSQANNLNSNIHNPEGRSGQFECFEQNGLHFIHINVRSLTPKIDELRLIAKNSNAAVVGVSET